MKQKIKDILEFFREEAANNRDPGDKFEHFIAAYLTKEPYYANHFSDVWFYSMDEKFIDWNFQRIIADKRKFLESFALVA